VSAVRDLAAQLAYEDEQEDIGRLEAAGRVTCHTCEAWATDEHIESPEHKRRIGIPADWRYDEREGRFRPPGVRENEQRVANVVAAVEKWRQENPGFPGVMVVYVTSGNPVRCVGLDLEAARHGFEIRDGDHLRLVDIDNPNEPDVRLDDRRVYVTGEREGQR
jgi:hypothetical protein